jgi:ribonucleoside-diphosphate reductase alpha chain
MATSVIDYIFRELAVTYLNRNDLAHVDESEITNKSEHRSVAEPDFESEEIISEKTIELDNAKVLMERLSQEPAEQKGMAISLHQSVMKARERGYTGDICPECQSMTMVRNGTCLKCNTCGSTTGCS